MNFFEYQDKAHRKTKLLVLYFIVAIILIMVAVNAAVYAVLFGTELTGEIRYNHHLQKNLWQYISAGVLIIIFLGTLLKIFKLRHGGRSVAEMVKARPILSGTQDLNERRLINIVEEMAIASGVNMPTLYVMDNELAINAFVAGTKPMDTVLVVTKGTLDALNRDELQGVIGHEFSHIFNGDMQINLRLIGVLAGILAIGQVGRGMLRSTMMRGRRRTHARKSNVSATGGVALIAIALFMIGYIGLFFGALIKAAISRERELLADASAVQYTRNPKGIAGALMKIKQQSNKSHLSSKHAEDISHMCFGESLSYFFALFNTHPPLELRIERLDKSVNLESEVESTYAINDSGSIMANLNSGMSAFSAVSAANVASMVGQISESAVRKGEWLYSQIPEMIREQAHDSNQVIILLLSFVLPKDDAYQIQSKYLIEQRLGAAQWDAMQLLRPEFEKLERALYLPIIEISLPALMQNDDATLSVFLETLKSLCRMDKKVTVFEFAILHLITYSVKPESPKKTYKNFEPVLNEIALVLSFVLAASKMSKLERENCFKKVYAIFSKETVFLNTKNLKPSLVDSAIINLNGLVPALKQTLIEAIALCIIRDGQIEVEESELLRVIAATLDCPIPPLIV